MKIWSEAFEHGQRIPERHALGKGHPQSHATVSDNVSPPLQWRDLPPGTKSLVLLVHDQDVPSRPDDVNKEGRTVPYDLSRVDFFHWVLVDLPPEPASLDEGEFARGMTPRGKKGPEGGPRGTRQGLNGYTQWFQGDPELEGEYFGFDGPWPPWNDARLHTYHFTLYALDVERCPVSGKFDGEAVRKAIEGHVLGQARLTATYAINPEAR
jgi:Raf kinase inhibitor-like YbhB/YbcL family protein